MTEFLTCAAYDAAEKAAETLLPNRLIEACRTVTFGHVGYPVRIADDRALFRYVDVMHEGRFESDFTDWAQGLTEEEFTLYGRIARAVVELTREKFGRPILPKAGLLRALITFRHLRLLQTAPAVIAEIGPGCGYLTALFRLSGYDVIATDIAQAFYLWQSLLWRHLFADQLLELAADARDLSNCPIRGIVHVPWWKFTLPDPSAIGKLCVDLVTPNQMLCEMHPTAVAYLALQCAQWFKHDRRGIVAFDGFGSTLLQSPDNVLAAFAKRGLTLSFTDHRINVLEAQPSDIAARFEQGCAALARTVNLERIQRFQMELVGDDLWTDDERFTRAIYL